MKNATILGSGDGTRPTTSGGVDNIGAGEKFSSTTNEAGENVAGPAPSERMRSKRQDAESTKQDESAAFGLTQDLTPETNKDSERVGASTAAPSREEAIRRAAYAAYERRGEGQGNEVQDWLDAEAEVDRRGQ